MTWVGGVVALKILVTARVQILSIQPYDPTFDLDWDLEYGLSIIIFLTREKKKFDSFLAIIHR